MSLDELIVRLETHDRQALAPLRRRRQPARPQRKENPMSTTRFPVLGTALLASAMIAGGMGATLAASTPDASAPDRALIASLASDAPAAPSDSQAYLYQDFPGLHAEVRWHAEDN